MDKEYITDYINIINESLGINVSGSVEEAVLTRYALYGYCVGNKMYCWSELFERLEVAYLARLRPYVPAHQRMIAVVQGHLQSRHHVEHHAIGVAYVLAGDRRLHAACR